MDPPNDPIKALLETTGLSCDDLLQKLLAYKSQKVEPKSTNNDSSASAVSNLPRTENGNCSTSSPAEIINSSSQVSDCSKIEDKSKKDNEEKERTSDITLDIPIEKETSQSTNVANGTTVPKFVDPKEHPTEKPSEEIDEELNRTIGHKCGGILEEGNSVEKTSNAISESEGEKLDEDDSKEKCNISTEDDGTIINEKTVTDKKKISDSLVCKLLTTGNTSEDFITLNEEDGDKQSDLLYKQKCSKGIFTENQLESGSGELLPESDKLLSENGEVLPERDKILSEIEQISSEREKLPSETEQLPSENSELPPENDKMSYDNKKSTSENEKSPSETEELLSENEKLPSENEKWPSQNKKLPPEEILHSENKKTPSENEELLSGNHKLPCENEKITSEKEKLPSENQKLPSEEILLSENKKISSENDKSPSQNEKLPSENENLPSENEKLSSLDNNSCASEEKSTSLPKKRKSISDELVRRLVQRIDEDEKGELDEEEHETVAIDNSSKIISTDKEDLHAENDIEVCQVEEIEENERKPLIKLRNDLFETNCKIVFTSSEDESDGKEEVDRREMKEFLKTVEEVKGDPVFSEDKSRSPNDSSNSARESNSPNIRKIKVGFLKKKILHKAIKQINLADSRKFEILKTPAISSDDSTNKRDHDFQMPLPKFTTESEGDAQDEIRKNLKLQLSSLRNKKKSDLLIQDTSNKVPSMSPLKKIYEKKKLINEKIRSSLPPVVKTLNVNNVVNPKIVKRKTSLSSDFTNKADASSLFAGIDGTEIGAPSSLPNIIDKESGVCSSFADITNQEKRASSSFEGIISGKADVSSLFAHIADAQAGASISLADITNEVAVKSSSFADVTNKEDTPFRLSDETSFMIVDVQGGVEFPEIDEDSSQVEKTKEILNDTIKLTKTDDITKIKGWKNKKFEKELTKEMNNSDKNLQGTFIEDDYSSSMPNIDDSNLSHTLALEENSNEELSPFVSNTLEEFLTENSKLNISYKIPKLGAEEGLKKQNYKGVLVSKTLEPPTTSESEKKVKYKGAKPKTLAEKRRMLEGYKKPKKRDVLKDEKAMMSKTSYVCYNGHTLYVPSTSSNKYLADIKHKSLRKIKQVKPETNETDSPKKLSLLGLWHEKHNTVTYKPGPLSRKSQLQSSETMSNWVTVAKRLPKIKLEIVTQVGKPIPPHLVHLLPKFGPIIHDDRLEFALSAVYIESSRRNTKSSVKHTETSEKHTKASETLGQGFRFTAPYANNQKYIMVRKEKKEFADNNVLIDISPERNSVRSVIDDLISYVENKEKEYALIQEAEPYEELENDIEPKKINEINIVDEAVKKHKRRKLDIELQRLSCKVVNVTVDESEVDNSDCRKSFCKFGCICRSLACAPRLPTHCLNKECMFECKCAKNTRESNEIAVTSETSLLSSDTVTRIEDQAKKYLAKVEKEFTQTIIHANDKTILIPSSDRSKTKRVKRTPKRYSDYCDAYNEEGEDEEYTNILKDEEKTKESKTENYNCSVKLQKLDIETVIPLCMDHNCYNCPCINDSQPKIKEYYVLEEDIVEDIHKPRRTKRRKTDEEEDYGEEDTMEDIYEPPRAIQLRTEDGIELRRTKRRRKRRRRIIESDDNSDEQTKQSERISESKDRKKRKEKSAELKENAIEKRYRKEKYTESGEVIYEKKKRKENIIHSEENSNDQQFGVESGDSDILENINLYKYRRTKQGCARIFGVHPEFLARNSIPYYKNKLKARIKNSELPPVLYLSESNMHYTEQESDIIDVTKKISISGADRLKLLMSNVIRKRKQVLEVRDDSELSYQSKPKKLKVKKRTSQESSSESNVEQKSEILPYSSVFDGEIVIPTNENKDFVKKLGVKSVAPYMRLLPWNDLLRNYYDFKINIWCSHERSDKLLINTYDRTPPEGYVEITRSKRKNGIMMWILTKELPKQTPGELVHLILSPNDEHFEISGICLKNIPTSQARSKTKKVKVKKEASPEEELVREFTEQREPTKTDSEDDKGIDSESNFLEHKNHNNELNVLCMTQHEYCPQYFHLDPNCENDCNENFPLPVELPSIGSQCRWRMLYLNSNFSFLSFINNKYSIKYTDLMHIVKRAQNSNKTICLQSQMLSSGYSQKNYGIYAVPKYWDRLFIGPYKQDEDHGIETLRYLRQSLVSTSYFEMVQGGANPNNKKAVWLITKTVKNRDKVAVATNTQTQQSLLRKKLTPRKILPKINSDSIKSFSGGCRDYAELTPIPDIPIDFQPTNSGSIIAPESQALVLQKQHEQSRLLDSCENFVTSMDLEERPFIKFPQFILLNGRKMQPTEYNRFIMTNIPHFGYLGASQNEQSKTIDVNWPFANKILRFPNVTAATEFLKRRFTNLLLPVPASFQISLIILREIDYAIHSAVNAKILSGTYICGEFGVLDSRKLTPELAETLGTTQEDVLKRLAKRAQYLVRCRLRTLGLFLLPKDEQLEDTLDNVAYITNLGALEIGKLKEQERVYIQTKKELIMKKQNNLAKYMTLLMNLPEKQRLEEYDKFRNEFNKRPKTTVAPTTAPISAPKAPTNDNVVQEVIEIGSDSDDPESGGPSKEATPLQAIDPTPSTSPSKKNVIMRSLLKPNISPKPLPPLNSDNVKPLTGYKFLKTSSGKLILMKDDAAPALSSSLSGMKLTIRNNKVIKRDSFDNESKEMPEVDASSSEQVEDIVQMNDVEKK